MSIIHLLSNNAYLIVNKYIVVTLGLDAAIMLGELASEHEYWESQGKLEDGFFFSTIENVYNSTTLTGHQQRVALKSLESQGIVEVQRRGVPAKRFIRLNEQRMLEIFNLQLLKNLTTSCQKNEQQEVKKFNGNNNKSILINNKYIYEQEFEQVWERYPRKRGKDRAFKAYIKARKEGIPKEDIEQGLLNYIAYIKENQVGEQYIQHGSTWFTQRRWTDDYSMRSEDKRNDLAEAYKELERELYE